MKYKFVLVVLASLGLASCLSNQGVFYKDSYRSNVNIDHNKICFQKNKLKGCPQETFYMNEDGSKTVVILEIDEQGKFINQVQADAILDYVKKKSSNIDKSKPIIMTYVHGWNHNALESDDNWLIPRASLDRKPNDGDLKKFGNAIYNLYESQNEIIEARASQSEDKNVKNTGQREIIGIYIAWRGKVLPKPLNYITFWDRKAVSEEVGRGDLQRFLLQLETIAKPNKLDNSQNSVLITIGHSFGGSALYNALSPILLSRFFQSVEDKKSILKNSNSKDSSNVDKIPLRGYGDLVILFNPAIEATRFMSLREAIWRERLKNTSLFDDNSKPLFVSVGGSGDIATRKAFKVGRALNTFFTENYRKTLLINGNGEASTGIEYEEEEWKLDTTSIGNYSPFYTHWVIQRKEYKKDNNTKKMIHNRARKLDLNESPLLNISKEECEFDTGITSFVPSSTAIEIPLDSGTPLLIADHFVSRFPDKKENFEDWPRNEPTKTTTASSSTWKNNPYWFVRASTDVISNHTDIWNRPVSCFILEVLLRNNVGSHSNVMPRRNLE